jgi:hypothetical protein
MPLQDALELAGVGQCRADLVASRFARTETLDVTTNGIERFLEHTMVTVEQVDRAHKLRIAQLETRKIMIVLDMMMRVRVAEQMSPEMP